MRVIHLLAGPLCAVLMATLLPQHYVDAHGAEVALASSARWTLGCVAWMAWWWFTEPVPLPVTSLLPALLFPLLNIARLEKALSPYADPLLFLFLGGFLLAAAIEKWGLHRRFAISLLRLSNGHAARLVLALMSGTAFISLWLSNTATAVLMFPVALSLARHESADANLGKCLILGVAYAATIGGMGTLIGTPPNIFVASYLQGQYEVTIEFWRWLLWGIPTVSVMLPLCWWWLTRRAFRLGETVIPLPAPSTDTRLRWRFLPPGARLTLVIFAISVVAWITRGWLIDVEWRGTKPLQNVSDASIALAAALALFVVPVGPARESALTWSDTRELPWGTLLLFGGGLSLAAAVSANGVDTALGAWLTGTPQLPRVMMFAAVAALVIFVSEVASNIATAAAMTPLLTAAAPALGISAVEIALVTALAASSAFMLPVGTAPNALAYGSGLVTSREMIRTGLFLNLLSIALIVGVAIFVLPRAL